MIDAKASNIVIVGQGAIGLLLYAHLAKTPALHLSLLTSNKHNFANFTFSHYQQKSEIIAVNKAAHSHLQSADVVIYCVKSYQVAAAIQSHQIYFNKNATIVLAHNGMGTLAELPKAVLTQPIIAMLLTHGSKKLSAEHVEHTGLGQIDVGLINGRLAPERQQSLIALFQQSLPPVHWHQDIVKKQWLKLTVNCVINPITALNNINNGEVNQERFAQSIKNIIAEIVAVSAKEGLVFTQQELEGNVAMVAQATAKNCSSMRADVLNHKTTEIDHINGYIHRLGLKQQVATPENSRLWQAVKALKNSDNA